MIVWTLEDLRRITASIPKHIIDLQPNTVLMQQRTYGMHPNYEATDENDPLQS